MKVAAPTLNTLLNSNVLEIRFQRRRPKPGDGPYRRMICTNSREILESEQGISLLHFKSSNPSARKFNPASKNLVIVWDIFMQDYRCVNVNNLDIISVIPGNEEFWSYYNESLLPMSPDDKVVFMNS
jgi:hypothetical protein